MLTEATRRVAHDNDDRPGQRCSKDERPAGRAHEWKPFGMSVDDESARSRRFVANPGLVGIGPNWSPKRAYLQMYGFLAFLIAGIGVVALVLSASPESETRAYIGLGAGFGFLIAVLVGLLAYYRRHSEQKILIGVTGDGLTVNKRPGDIFPFTDMTLGPWGWGAGTMGAALHLRCGRHRFVLGGRDHRIGSGTRLDEAPVPGVDAWLWAAEFDQILTMVGRRTELDVRRPTPGEPTRYVLFPNPLRIQAASPSRTRKQLKLFRSASNLAVDVGADEIRVIDPNTNALIASASPAQVTATPATYQYPYTHLYPSLNNVMTDIEMQYLSKAPELILRVPGMQPLAVACLEVGGAMGVTRRFSWRGDVPVQDEPAEYAVSGADWLMLVEKFGLAPRLENRGEQGPSSSNALVEVPQDPPRSPPQPEAPATPLSMSDNRHEEDRLIPSSRRRGGWGTIVGLAIASVAVVSLGGFPVWVQHFGAPDRIMVDYCSKPSSRHISHLVLDYVVGTCHGTTLHRIDASQSSLETRVEFWGAYQKDLGHEIDVHIKGAEAVVDGWLVPPLVLGMGCVLGVCTAIAIAGRLRRRPR